MSTRYNTGNPIESTDVRDMSDNAKNLDLFSNSSELSFDDRFGVERKTIHGMNSEFDGMIVGMNSEFDAQILNMGFTRVGTFLSGATLTNPRQTLLWDIADGGDGQEYGWSGTFPKIVPPGRTPSSTGGIAVGAWMSRFDHELRIMVRESIRRSYAEAGYNLVDGSFEAGGTLVNASDVLLQESTGKAFSGPAGTVAAGTDPASGGFVDRSNDTHSYNAFTLTESQATAMYLGIGAIIFISDRANAAFKTVNSTGMTVNGFDILSTAVPSAVLQLQRPSHEVNLKHLGAKADSTGFGNGTLNDAVLDYALSLKCGIYAPEGEEIYGFSQRANKQYRFAGNHSIKESGMAIRGDNWATAIGTNAISSGTIFNLVCPADTAFLTIDKDDQTDIERIVLSSFGVQSNTRCDVIVHSNLRHYLLDNLYFTGVRDCINGLERSWMGQISRCQGFDFTRYGLRMNSGGEDTLATNLIFRGYGLNSIGLDVNAYSATNRFVMCDFSNNKENVRIVVGSGAQSLQYFDSCIFESTEGAGALGANHTSIVIAGSPVKAVFNGCRGNAVNVQAGRSFSWITGGAEVEFSNCSATGYPFITKVNTVTDCKRLVFENFNGVGTTNDFAGPVLELEYFDSINSFGGKYDLVGRSGKVISTSLSSGVSKDFGLILSGDGLYEISAIDTSGFPANYSTWLMTSKGTGGNANGFIQKTNEGSGNKLTLTWLGSTLTALSSETRNYRITISRLS